MPEAMHLRATGQVARCTASHFYLDKQNIFATGRNGAAHDALCVEVLKTSAGLGLSLDGGKSSVSGDGPLVIKRVYKGKVYLHEKAIPPV